MKRIYLFLIIIVASCNNPHGYKNPTQLDETPVSEKGRNDSPKNQLREIIAQESESLRDTALIDQYQHFIERTDNTDLQNNAQDRISKIKNRRTNFEKEQIKKKLYGKWTLTEVHTTWDPPENLSEQFYIFKEDGRCIFSTGEEPPNEYQYYIEDYHLVTKEDESFYVGNVGLDYGLSLHVVFGPYNQITVHQECSDCAHLTYAKEK